MLTSYQNLMLGQLLDLGCAESVARQIAMGSTFGSDYDKWIYLSGPMRNIPQFNFPAFDAARDRYVALGYNVISPADIDRAAGNTAEVVDPEIWTYIERDYYSLKFVGKRRGGIVLLDGWEHSTGAFAEFAIARWGNLKLRRDAKPDSLPLIIGDLGYERLQSAISKSLVERL